MSDLVNVVLPRDEWQRLLEILHYNSHDRSLLGIGNSIAREVSEHDRSEYERDQAFRDRLPQPTQLERTGKIVRHVLLEDHEP